MILHKIGRILASMRPKRFRFGEPRRQTNILMQASCFNEAEAFPLRRDICLPHQADFYAWLQ